jgi:chromosome segregation ATPase
MTKEQRDAAVASATGDRDNIAAEVKTDQDALKPINDEIAQHEKDATDAEALAKNPPADVSADDKNGYIDGKKNDAQTARDAAKESRDRLKEAQKNLDDAKARLAVANGKLAHPEVPVTDDEKAQAKTENEQAITDAKKAIDDDDQVVATLKETIAAGPMNLGGNDKEKPDPDNLALMQKHLKDYLDAIGASDMLKAK